jgi:subtilisin family serine protease
VPPFVSGVAPRAELVPIRTSPTVVLLSMRNLIRAIEYAIEQKFHVLSISMGGLGSFTLQKVVQRAVAEGVIVVAAAGNRVKFVVHPGAYPEVVCMAASNFDDKPWSGSCRGPAVTVSGPGESVWRARVFLEKGKLRTAVEPSSGTSYAVAVTAGIAAMWLSHHGRQKLIAKLGGKHLLAPTFKKILMATARVPAGGWDKTKFGAGIVDAKKVLEADPLQFVPASAAAKAPISPAAEVRRRLGTIAGLDRKDDAAIATAIAGLTGAATTSATRMADLGPELAFLAATDPTVQKALEAAAGSGDATAAAARVGPGAVTALRGALSKRRGRLSKDAAEALQL